MNHKKLLEIFIAKLDEVCPLPHSHGARKDAWQSIMDKYGCMMIPSGQMADLVNNGPGDYVCMESLGISVFNSHGLISWVEDHWALVPKELALKVLVLGYFPDSPSIQKMREPA